MQLLYLSESILKSLKAGETVYGAKTVLKVPRSVKTGIGQFRVAVVACTARLHEGVGIETATIQKKRLRDTA